MAQSIKELYSDTKFFVGPVIENGFYYDFKSSTKLNSDDLKLIEKKMKENIKKKFKIDKYFISKDKAIQKFSSDELKLKVLEKIEDKNVSIYKQGEFEDLCRGPHVPSTRFLHNFKLTRIAGAYLGGDETKEMLTRIYGVAFSNKEDLKEYVTRMEKAKKIDHRKLGKEMELFMFSEESGAGLPFWMPRGARLREKLENILHKAHRKQGYQLVRGPQILKSHLWETSGHYTCYGENIYLTNIDNDEYAIKPMNCIGHIQIFKKNLHSYKNLPIKFYEYGTVHRHEKSGVLHGLLRVREFTQDDAHIFCSEKDIKQSIIEIIDFVDKVMKLFNFKYSMSISTKPEKAIGSDEIWNLATSSLKEALNKKSLKYNIDEGGGAFYGPKIDIKITDAIGREWQCGTIQIDFNLPKRFDVTYVDKDGTKKHPVMIHRAILGSFERFIAILIEHYAGEFPFFLAPVQIIIIPILDSHIDYVKKLLNKLLDLDIDGEILHSNDTLNKKIRIAEKRKVPIIIVIGDNEISNSQVSVRDRETKKQYNLNLEDFMLKLRNKIDKGKIFE